MKLFVDADSLIFSSAFADTIDIAKNSFDRKLTEIVKHLEEFYEIEEVRIFNGSLGNFRNIITKEYKANRKASARPELLGELHNLIKFDYDTVFEYGVETDDVVAKHWFNECKLVGRDNVMIVSIDKDYKQFACLMYNYHPKHKCILDITVEQARYNFYEQMIAGDTADNVNYFKGKGVSFAAKYFEGCVTDYQYRKQLYLLFKEKYKSKAKEKYSECYNLLKLRTE
jgi:hypothetical protein